MTYNSESEGASSQKRHHLDRIETDLETIKEILLATARRAEATDTRLDRLSEKQDRTQEQLDRLREDVDTAFETIKLLSENTNRSIAQSQQEMREFRVTMTQLQVENRQIWEYLMRQYQNGNGDGGQPPAVG